METLPVNMSSSKLCKKTKEELKTKEIENQEIEA